MGWFIQKIPCGLCLHVVALKPCASVSLQVYIISYIQLLLHQFLQNTLTNCKSLNGRAFHEKNKRPKGGHTRLQFFLLVFVASFAYYIIPSYFFPSITAVSFVCLIWKNSVTAQQIGSGNQGLGIGSFGLDWSTVAGFLGSPLPIPLFAILNTMAGFVLFFYIMNPIAYWSNAYDAKKFPIFSSHTFDSTGAKYNISRILNDKTFDIDMDSYNNYSKLHLSVFFAVGYSLSFATLTATISHVFLFHGK